ncbi:hypothetical protein DFJ73DRAFT_822198 [Zopfochytrium polystomum]|nr:hypothetical protein DFJ73DRAFT_822198 [Zopfochytrium polystomum]
MFFRELPRQVMCEVRPTDIINAQTEEQATRAIANMSSSNRDLLDWALDIMSDVLYFEAENRMGLQTLCSVWAPNLLATPTVGNVDHNLYAAVSVHLPDFVGLLLMKRMRDLEE